jgi:hypothetical protein
MRLRRLHRAYAFINGYFWLPCPLCGRHFGGHEHGGVTRVGNTLKAICPACKAARDDDSAVWWQN